MPFSKEICSSKILLLLAFSCAVLSAQSTEYRVVDLGVPGSAYPDSMATGINRLGHIVGYSGNFVDAQRGSPNRDPSLAFFWRDGKMSVLPPLPGHDSSNAIALNDSDQIVGISFNMGDLDSYHFVRWENGTPLDLGPGRGHVDINSRGQIILGNFSGAGLLWENGKTTKLDFDPVSINNRGEIVGRSGSHWVIWKEGATHAIDLPGVPNDLNDNDEITGFHVTGGDAAWLVSNEGKLSPIGPLEGTRTNAYALNNRGQVVGEGGYSFVTHAFVWQNGTIATLPPVSSYNDSKAFHINDAGQIVGYGSVLVGNKNRYHAVLWAPVK